MPVNMPMIPPPLEEPVVGPMPPPEDPTVTVQTPPTDLGAAPAPAPEAEGFSVSDLQLEDMVPSELLSQLTSEATAQSSPWEAVSLGLLAVSDPDLALGLMREKQQGKQVARQTLLGLRSQVTGFNKSKMVQESQFERAREDAKNQESRRVLQDRSDSVDQLTRFASEAGVEIPPPPPDLQNDAQYTAWYRAVQPAVADKQRRAAIAGGLVKELGTMVDKGGDAEGIMQYMTGRARQLGIKPEELPGFMDELSGVIQPMAKVANDKHQASMSLQRARMAELGSQQEYRASMMENHVAARDSQDDVKMRQTFAAVTASLQRADENINKANYAMLQAQASGDRAGKDRAQAHLANLEMERNELFRAQQQIQSDLDYLMTSKRLQDPGTIYMGVFNEVMQQFTPDILNIINNEPYSVESQMFQQQMLRQFMPPTLTPAERERRMRYLDTLEIKNQVMPFQPMPAGGGMQQPQQSAPAPGPQ